MLAAVALRFIQLSLALVLLAAVALPAVAGAGNPANQIAGLWDAVATPDPGGPVEGPLLSYTTMGMDGTMVVVGPGGASAGAWQRTRGRGYDISFLSFSEVAPDFFVRIRVDATVDLSADGQQFSGPFHTSVFDLGGNFLFDFEGTVEGNRIPISGF